MEKYLFEKLQKEHINRILEIYNYYVLNTTSTYHTQPLSVEEMGEIVLFDNPRYSSFVIKEGDLICGYVILSQHKKRQAYDGTGEIGLYLDRNYTGKGIGNIALKYIENIAKLNQFHVLIATVSGDNQKSISLFEKNGFQKCAHYKEVGYKFGKLLDVVALQKIL